MSSGGESSTTTVPHIPEDILIQILHRIPAKSLLRFRCVSKQWQRSISDPQFSKLHLRRSTADHRNHRLVLAGYSSLWSTSYNDNDEPDTSNARLRLPFQVKNFRRDCFGNCFVSLLCSCDGLLCLNLEENNILLWNPCTREYRKLPNPGKFPHDSVAIYGLGYDSSIDGYKLVRALSMIRTASDLAKMEISVLTLKSEEDFWRVIGTYPYYSSHSMAGTFVNGAIHFAVESNYRGVNHPEHVISVDLAEENVAEVPQPPPCHGGDSRDIIYLSLGALSGCLCLLRTFVRGKLGELWLMKEYGVGSSWILLTSITDWSLGGVFDCVLPLLRYTDNAGGVLVMELRQEKAGLFKFNLGKMACKDLSNLSGAPKNWIAATTYIESLMSPNANNGTTEIASRNGEESSGEGESLEMIANGRQSAGGFVFRHFLFDNQNYLAIC